MKRARALNYTFASSGGGRSLAPISPSTPFRGAGAPRYTLRALLSFACAALLSAAPVIAGSKKAEAGRQMEFGVQMALQGSWHEAAFRFKKAAEADPENPRALNNLAVALEASGKFEDAAEAYGKALELDPGNHQIRENKVRLEAYLASRTYRAKSGEGDSGGGG